MNYLSHHRMAIKTLLWNVKGWRGKGEELATRRMQEYDVRIITETNKERARGPRNEFGRPLFP